MSARNIDARALQQPALGRRSLRAPNTIADAYDHVGHAYTRYADGEEADDPASAAVRSAHADTIVWQTLRTAIGELRDQGVSCLRVLDAGCGPGTWLTRIAADAHRQALDVEGVGFDISGGQLAIARERASSLLANSTGRSRPKLKFVEYSLTEPLPWPDGHFHMVLCNFAVLNHLPRAALPGAIGELCRVASDRVVATLRALASPPTACIVGPEQVYDLREDCARGELAVTLKDGTRHVLTFNLYSADTLRALFASEATILDLRAVDLFVSRFAPDARWTEVLVNRLAGRPEFVQRLKDLEEPLCRLPGWIDHGTHVLVAARPMANAAGERQQ
jgi:SAM-dependent methyltransferase